MEGLTSHLLTGQDRCQHHCNYRTVCCVCAEQGKTLVGYDITSSFLNLCRDGCSNEIHLLDKTRTAHKSPFTTCVVWWLSWDVTANPLCVFTEALHDHSRASHLVPAPPENSCHTVWTQPWRFFWRCTTSHPTWVLLSSPVTLESLPPPAHFPISLPCLKLLLIAFDRLTFDSSAFVPLFPWPSCLPSPLNRECSFCPLF